MAKEPQKKENLVSKDTYKELFQKAIKQDFSSQIRVAMEMKTINPKIAIRRFYELLLLYPNEKEKQKLILQQLFEIYRDYDSIDNFIALFNQMVETKIISEEYKTIIEKEFLGSM